jgi:putative transcriptional regulator
MNRIPPENPLSQPEKEPNESSANGLPNGQSLGPSLAGLLLVATPKLTDDVFGQSVCLLLEHGQERAVGVMLNRPFGLDIRPLWAELTSGLSKTAQPPKHLHFGGPVSGPVVAIHDRASLAEAGNGNGVYFAAQIENLKKLALIPPEHYRLFIGHSAWQPGQLEQEIRDGFWYPLPADREIVFAEDTDMWQQGLRRVGKLMWQSVIGLPEIPQNPGLN